VSGPKPRRPVELLARTDLSPSVCDYRLRVRDQEPFDWAPGQYVELFAPSQPDEPLPYSIASAPDPTRPGVFELAVGNGSGRELLAAVPIGGELTMSGPRGHLLWPPTGHSALMIGVGTGVAPLRALVQACLGTGDTHPIILLCGFRSEGDVLWRDEFERLASENDHFRYDLTLTLPSPLLWSGRRGRVQEHAVELAQALEQPTVFLCGSRLMVDDVQRLLEQQADVPASAIFAEGY
jgi:CDP-4-dehydro-6-deoxyglucose reductase, E3